MDAAGIAARAVRAAYLEAVRHYHRLDITIEEPVPDTPCLIVANHGFGGIFDLNIYATLAALQAATTRPVSALTHQMAWTFGVGGAVEQVGAIPANRQSALDALARGEHVLVFPGGDYDAAKPWCRRNEVVFHGRTGFAQLALDADVPIVPVVTAGAGESLLVLSAGTRLAHRLGLRRWLRVDTLPVSVSVPWGLNIGLVAVMPYLPAPTKLNTVVIPAVRPRPGQQREQLAAQVHHVM
jgi:1-acyl-sn-glycerol-3-phosphate acyltransferase